MNNIQELDNFVASVVQAHKGGISLEQLHLTLLTYDMSEEEVRLLLEVVEQEKK